VSRSSPSGDGGLAHVRFEGEAAQTAGTGIKKHYPTLQVAVYDGVETNKVIELPWS
jgi:hypothetical protein